MLYKIAIITIIGGIIISYYSYKTYMNSEEENEYLTKTFIRENERQCNNKSITHKKTYIKTIIIRKKNENEFKKLK